MATLVRRLREPPFGTETSERNLMNAAADRIEALEATLAFYADPANWTEPEQVNKQELFDTAMGNDLGAVARAALTKE